MANPTIGKILCPIGGDQADLRRCATGKKTFYWHGIAGKVTPNLAAGQRYIFDHGEFMYPVDKEQLAKRLGIDYAQPASNDEPAPARIQEAPGGLSRIRQLQAAQAVEPEPVAAPRPYKPAQAPEQPDTFLEGFDL